jgi:hypothetical protein
VCRKLSPALARLYFLALGGLHFVKTIINRFILVHPVRGAIVTGRFYNLWQKALFYKAFLSFWGKKLSEKNNPTLCEPSGLEPSTISHL